MSRAGAASSCSTSARWRSLPQSVDREGMTMVPLKIYFNDQGRAKLLLAVARGKKLHDKRETEKQRDWTREKGRLIKERG